MHPNLNLEGGAEYVGLEFLNALQEDHDVILFTLEDPDLESLNSFYGTDVERGFDVVEVPFPLSLFGRTGDSFNKLRNFLIKWYALRKEDGFDLMVSTHNEAAFTGKGLQYIHFPDSVNEELYLDKDEVSFDLGEDRSFIAKIYLNLVKLFMPDAKEVRNVPAVCNSNYTRNVFDEAFDHESEVISPPVSIEFESLPDFEDREDAFVCVGGISPTKDQKGLIRIFDELNKEFDLDLYIIGSGASKYADEVENMAEKRDFVHFEGRLSREEMKERISGVKYGIHNQRGEHYGLAPAEMVKAGCVVFVREKGGQTDIVNNQRELIFSGESEAVKKISKVVSDDKTRDKVLSRLDSSGLNSPEEFREKILEKVEEVKQ